MSASDGRGPTRIGVLIAEDEPDARLLLEMQLQLEPGFEVVGSVADGQEALDFCRAHGPDVVVMDLLMPRLTGIEAIAILREESPEIGLVAHTAVAGPVVRSLPDQHAVEVVLKSGDPSHLVDAVRRVAERARGRTSGEASGEE